MKNKENNTDRVINRFIRYATFAGIVVACVHLWSVPSRLDAVEFELDSVEFEVKDMRIDHGERLAWIEGALSGNQPAPPDSTLAPVQTGALAAVPAEPDPETDE